MIVYCVMRGRSNIFLFGFRGNYSAVLFSNMTVSLGIKI